MKFVPHIHHTKVSSKEAVVQDNKANNYSNSSVHSSLMVETEQIGTKKKPLQRSRKWCPMDPLCMRRLQKPFSPNWLKGNDMKC